MSASPKDRCADRRRAQWRPGIAQRPGDQPPQLSQPVQLAPLAYFSPDDGAPLFESRQRVAVAPVVRPL